MDNPTDFLNFLFRFQDTTNVFTPNDVIFTIVLSFVLSLVIGWVYKITHRSTSYTQSYVHTLVLMSMVVGIVMLIIGSNIARAFTLVGALSIVRFRNAIKETRDVGYIFFAMVVGMASGTRFYLLAIISTLVICFLIWGMTKMDMFAKEVKEQILKIRIASDMPYETIFERVFNKYLARADLMAMETVQAGLLTELVYGIELKRPQDAQAFMEELRQLTNNNKVALVTGYHEVDL